MDKKRHATLLVLVIMALLLPAACAVPQPTSTPPLPTPTSIPPTATGGPTPETALESMTTEHSVIYRDIPYIPGGNRQQTLSMYLPIKVESSPGMKHPVIVLAHGVTCRKEDSPLAEIMRFANQLGYAAVTMGYRDDDESGNP